MKVRRSKNHIGEIAKTQDSIKAVAERLHRSVLDRSSTPSIETIPYGGISPMVTLDDPNAAPTAAHGAFARLQPPHDHPDHETASWADSVRAIAVAVKVVRNPRSNRVIVKSDVSGEERAPDDIRREATALAEDSEDPDLMGLVEQILSEVES